MCEIESLVIIVFFNGFVLHLLIMKYRLGKAIYVMLNSLYIN